VDRIHMAEDTQKRRALVYTEMNGRVPWNAGKFLTT